MEHNKIIDAIKIIDDFNKSPVKYIERINSEKKIQGSSLIRTEEYFSQQLLKISKEQKEAVDELSFRLDNVNSQIVKQLQNKITIQEYGLEIKMMPLNRIGIYIPKTMPSSAFTFLSAAKTAGVDDIVLYVAQDEKGEIDPLTIYVAKKYHAQIIGGPARVAFPTLAFGMEEVKKCDMICGPCGENMNLIKNICGLIGHVAVDMSAGASDLTIISDTENDWEQIHFDLLSQLEHGKDSTSQLIIVGDLAKESFHQSKWFSNLKDIASITIVYVTDSREAVDFVHRKSPETLEVFSDNTTKFESCFGFCGLVYINTSSTLGDYGVIGRGCADPTGGFAKGQSGISPLKFLKIVPIVSDNKIIGKHIEYGKLLAHYEGLAAHEKVLSNFEF